MKKVILSLFLLVAFHNTTFANEPIKGCIATYEGSEVSYKLEEMPTVRYTDADGVKYAQLYVNGQENPVASFMLANGKKLFITFAEYESDDTGETDIDKVRIIDRDNRKVIQGGKIIIIAKDGKKYTKDGVEIKI